MINFICDNVSVITFMINHCLFLVSVVSELLVLQCNRYVPLKSCITRLPDNGYGGSFTMWPARLHHPPDRLQTIKMDAFLSRNDIYKAESKYWKEITFSYVNVFRWKTLNVRNVMDMRARYGGYLILVASFTTFQSF